MATVRGGIGRRSRAGAWIMRAAIALAVLAAAALGSAGLGYRLGWWGLRPAFGLLQTSVYVASAALALALAGLALALVARSWTRVAVALVAGLVAAGAMAVPLSMRRTAASVPAIHDISTDTASPPEFVALRAVREQSPNGAAYGGARGRGPAEDGVPGSRPCAARRPARPRLRARRGRGAPARLGHRRRRARRRSARGHGHHALVRLQGRRRGAREPGPGGQPRRRPLRLPRRAERPGRQCRTRPRAARGDPG